MYMYIRSVRSTYLITVYIHSNGINQYHVLNHRQKLGTDNWNTGSQRMERLQSHHQPLSEFMGFSSGSNNFLPE